MTKLLQEVKIFLASPADATLDRETAIKIINDVDRSIAGEKGMHLKSITWEDVSPGTGRPEQVILDQITMNKIDVFVGIMWKKFGSPTGENFESGTEEEFHVAYDEWKNNQSPRVMFYFNVSTQIMPDSSALEQYSKVLQFKENLKEKALCKDYDGVNQFADMFRRDLIRVMLEIKGTKVQDIIPEVSLINKYEYHYYSVWRDALFENKRQGERVESYLYRSAKKNVKFMTISGRSIFSGDVEDVLKGRGKEFKLQILLYDWMADDFDDKMKAERRTTVPEIERARRKAKEIAREFCDLGTHCDLKLQIKLYKEYPIWRMLIVDEQIAYVGYYPLNKRGYEGPMFVFKKENELSLFYPTNDYFDWIWKNSGDILTKDDPRLQ
jgi:hypothetical protein